MLKEKKKKSENTEFKHSQSMFKIISVGQAHLCYFSYDISMEWIHLLSLNPIIKDNLASLVCGSLYKEKFAYHDHSDS